MVSNYLASESVATVVFSVGLEETTFRYRCLWTL